MRVVINALQYKQNSSGIGVMIRDLFGKFCEIAGRECRVVMTADAPEFPSGGRAKVVRIVHGYGESLRRMWFQSFRLGAMCGDSVLLTTDSKIPLKIPKSAVVMPLVTDLAVYRLGETYRLSRVLWWRFQYRILQKRADLFLAISEFTKRELTEILKIPEWKIEVVPCACGTNFRPVTDEVALADLRRKYALPERFILFVGNFNPRKNLERLIKAFDLMKENSNLPQSLVIAGEQGWKFDRTKALTGIKHQEKICFCGFVANEDMPALYSAADLFVFPTLYEGFGIPVLEAQNCGTPVLTANCSALPEVAGDAAAYVDPYNVESIAAGMERVLRDKHLAKNLVQAGYANVKRFSWQKSAELLNDIVEKEIAKREAVI